MSDGMLWFGAVIVGPTSRPPIAKALVAWRMSQVSKPFPILFCHPVYSTREVHRGSTASCHQAVWFKVTTVGCGRAQDDCTGWHSLVPDLADLEQPAARPDVGLLNLVGPAHHRRPHRTSDAVVIRLAESAERLFCRRSRFR